MKNFELALDYLTHAGNLESDAVRVRALNALKNQGLSISEAIKAVRAAANVSLGQAKEWVSTSAAWRETAARAEPLHDEVEQALGNLASPTARRRVKAV